MILNSKFCNTPISAVLVDPEIYNRQYLHNFPLKFELHQLLYETRKSYADYIHMNSRSIALSGNLVGKQQTIVV